MGKSKIIYGGTVLIDLTADTIADGKVLLGYKFHGPDGEIHTGSCTFDLDTSGATVKASEILIGKTAGARGTMITGEMPNNGAVAAKISTVNGEYIVPLGYHDGSGKCVIDPDEAAKIIAANIKKGVTILGVEGTYGGEAITVQSKTVDPLTTSQTVIPDEGYDYLSQVVVNAIYYNGATIALHALLIFVMGLDALVEEYQATSTALLIATLALGNVVFVIYDFLLKRLERVLAARKRRTE